MVETIQGDGITHAVLSFPPSANRYWRNYRGRMVKSQEARAYIENARIEAWSQVRGKATDKPVIFLCNLYFPNRRGDLDNRLKVVIDSMNDLMYQDDKQIVEIHATRRIDKENPRVEIWVEEFKE